MLALIGCEYSGTIRDAFRRLGHEAWSCDLPGVEPEGEFAQFHFRADVREVLDGPGPVWKDPRDGPRRPWDLAIFHPPCTHLAVSGARWWKDKPPELQRDALAFVRELMAAPIPRICIENPVSCISTHIRKPDQIIQPWQFGHGEVKATCLWLKGLPKLCPTQIVEGRTARVHRMPPSPDRWKERSRTLTGIADAMASQWGSEAAFSLCA